MNLTNLFENTSPSNNYCDQLAEKLPAGLKSDDDILDAAWDIVVKDLGRTVARNKFMDEDFPSDLIGAYKQGASDQLPQDTLDLIDEYIAKIEPDADRGELIKHVVDGSIDTTELEYAVQDDIAEGGPYDLPGIDYPRPGDTPKKPRYRGQSSPGVIPDDEDYFREIFRKKREAAKKAEREQDHDRLATGTNEGQQWPDSSNSLAKRSAVATNLKGAPSKAGRTSGMTVATRVDPTITSTKVQRKDDRPIPSFLQKGVAEGSEVDNSAVVGKLYDIIDHAEDVIKNADFDQQVRKATIVRDRAAKALGMIKSDPSNVTAAWNYLQNGEQSVAEADKKKEDELGTEVRDVSLQRAITQAKSDFPTAGSGIEALAKNLMRGQEQDKQDFEKIRAVDKDQERMLAQIAQVDQNQTQEIDNLEQDNTTLKRRLQQIQSVNARLEKTLASMSGRKKEKTTPADTSAGSFSPTASIPDAPATATSKPKTKSKTKAKSQPAKSSTKPVTRQIASPNPGAHAFSKMAPALSTADNPQASLFPSDYGQDSVNLAMQQIRKNALAGKNAGAQDVSFRDVMDPGSKSVERVARDDFGVQENNGQEAKYSDKYQDMVARVGQKAREQEKSKPVDIKDLARRLAAIDAKDKSAR